METARAANAAAPADASANGISSRGRNTGERTRPRTLAGAVKALFKDAVQAVTRRVNDAPQPEERVKKKEGETGRGAFGAAARIMRRVVNKPLLKSPGKSFRKAARGAAQRVIELPPEAYGEATAYLAETLVWLDLWQNDAGGCDWQNNDFDTMSDYPSPNL